MSGSMRIDDAPRPRTDTTVELRVFHDLRLARSMAIDVVPAIWVRVAELVRCDANDVPVTLMHLGEDKRQLSLQAMKTIPSAGESCKLRSWIFCERMEIEIVNGIQHNDAQGLGSIVSSAPDRQGHKAPTRLKTRPSKLKTS